MKDKGEIIILGDLAPLQNCVDEGKLMQAEFDALFTKIRRNSVLGCVKDVKTLVKNGVISEDDFQQIFYPLGDSESASSLEFRQKLMKQGGIKPFAVGGSDSGKITGVSHYGTAVGLYDEKLGLKSKKPVTQYSQDNFDYGHCFEDGIAKRNAMILAKKLGKRVTVKSCEYQWLNTRWPHCVADIDKILLVEGEKSPFLGEVKSALAWGDVWKQFSSGEYPDDYKSQVLFYMSVTPFKQGYFLAHNKNGSRESDFAQVPIIFDKDEAEEIMDICEEFVVNASKGIRPTYANVSNDKALERENAELYNTNPELPTVKLDKKKWKDSIKRMNELNEEVQQVNDKKRSLDQQYRKLCAEKKNLFGTFMEDIKDAPKAIYTDDNGKTFEISVSKTFSKDEESLGAMKELYPDAYEFLSKYKESFSYKYREVPQSVLPK